MIILILNTCPLFRKHFKLVRQLYYFAYDCFELKHESEMAFVTRRKQCSP